MAIDDVAGESLCHVRDILRKFMSHNFVSGLRTLKPKNLKKLKKPKNLKTFSKTPRFFKPRARYVVGCSYWWTLRTTDTRIHDACHANLQFLQSWVQLSTPVFQSRFPVVTWVVPPELVTCLVTTVVVVCDILSAYCTKKQSPPINTSQSQLR